MKLDRLRQDGLNHDILNQDLRETRSKTVEIEIEPRLKGNKKQEQREENRNTLRLGVQSHPAGGFTRE